MKKQTEPFTLERLLATVEHAGRDARRQEHLAEMIEQMAVSEAKDSNTKLATRSHVVRLWTIRIAAAACLVLFIMTAVRLWVNPIQPEGVKYAQAPTLPHPVIGFSQKEYSKPVSQQVVIHKTSVVSEVAVNPDEEVGPFLPEEAILEEAMPEDVEEVLVIELPVQDELPAYEYVAENEVEEEDEPESTAYAQAEPVPAKPARHSFFNLFLFAEPDLMEGNTLSLRLI